MKQIRILLNDKEFKKLNKIKEKEHLTWKDMLMLLEDYYNATD